MGYNVEFLSLISDVKYADVRASINELKEIVSGVSFETAGFHLDLLKLLPSFKKSIDSISTLKLLECDLEKLNRFIDDPISPSGYVWKPAELIEDMKREIVLYLIKEIEGKRTIDEEIECERQLEIAKNFSEVRKVIKLNEDGEFAVQTDLGNIALCYKGQNYGLIISDEPYILPQDKVLLIEEASRS